MSANKSVRGRSRPTASSGRRAVNPDTGTLSLIRASFPGREQLIEHGFREDRSFRALCEDYRRCVAALDRCKHVRETGEAPLWREYTELLADLGREIQAWLDAMETGSYLTGDRRP